MYRRDIPGKESTFPQRRRTPSFSSSLLDSIYRSTGGESRTHKEELRPTTRKQRDSSIGRSVKGDKTIRNLDKPIVMESWGEKRGGYGRCVYLNSASSSSDSSSGVEGGVFSSSEAESNNRLEPRISKQRMMDREMNQKQQKGNNNHPKGFNNDGFTKTKLKALKLYGELKKVKQPISPGGRITSFLSSIFNSNAKKINICSAGKTGDVGFERKSKSACSSATSYSRSCLNKTESSSFSSSTIRSNNGGKRSVRFYPVNVIIDEDCKPCVQKGINEESYSLKTEHKRYSGSDNQKRESSERVDDSGSDGWRNYQRKNTQLRGFLEDYAINDDEEEVEEEEEDDGENEDALSYSSSDLFELDHLIGNGRYGEELPVYETTSLKTNQAIANGIIL